jgi:hypothetical protein
LADLIRGNQNSQEYLSRTVVTVAEPKRNQSSDSNARSSQDQILTPPRPAVMALIVVAVGAEHLESYITRAAATYAFEVNPFTFYFCDINDFFYKLLNLFIF